VGLSSQIFRALAFCLDTRQMTNLARWLVSRFSFESEAPVLPMLILLPIMLIFFVLFVLRPQQKAQKERASNQGQVGVGDEVLTTAGFYGIVTALDDDDMWLEISEGSEIRVARGALMRITQSVNDPTDDDVDPIDADDADVDSEPGA
jgi:preprotein translocase subunit YajC